MTNALNLRNLRNLWITIQNLFKAQRFQIPDPRFHVPCSMFQFPNSKRVGPAAEIPAPAAPADCLNVPGRPPFALSVACNGW